MQIAQIAAPKCETAIILGSMDVVTTATNTPLPTPLYVCILIHVYMYCVVFTFNDYHITAWLSGLADNEP